MRPQASFPIVLGSALAVAGMTLSMPRIPWAQELVPIALAERVAQPAEQAAHAPAPSPPLSVSPAAAPAPTKAGVRRTADGPRSERSNRGSASLSGPVIGTGSRPAADERFRIGIVSHAYGGARSWRELLWRDRNGLRTAPRFVRLALSETLHLDGFCAIEMGNGPLPDGAGFTITLSR